MAYEKKVHDCMRELAAAGLVDSAHDLSDGGLAVALAESCTSEIGAKVTLPPSDELLPALFGEAQSRILITTSEPKQISAIASRFGVESPVIGSTMKMRLQIGAGDQTLIDAEVADLKHSHEATFPSLFALPTENANV
jgi:phosphoribosylformylglycinamidine synthase